MRTREEIRQQLLDGLSSSLWQKVRNSLVGKEWISLAVESIYMAEEQNFMLHSAFDYKTATREQLISMSHTYDIPVSFNRTDTVTLRLGISGKVYAPYSLSYRIGSVTYWNIDPVRSEVDIVLHQGVAHVGEEVGEMSTIYTKTSRTIDGYNIGDIVPDSVYCRRGDGVGIGRFNALNYGSNNEHFKLYTCADGTQMVVVGDGVWGKAVSISDIDYLYPTHTVVDANGGVLYIGGVQYSGQVSVLSTANGGDNDIDNARDTYCRYYLERNAVVSESQIKRYVSSFNDVLDCGMIRSGNVNNVYVKPTDKDSIGLTFDNIKASLLLYGELGSQFALRYGTRVMFSIMCANVSEGNIQKVSDYISKRYSYSSMRYSDTVDISSLVNDIRSLIGETPTLGLGIVGDRLAGGTLSSYPTRGSIKVIYRDGSIVAIDNGNGAIIRVNMTFGQSSMIGMNGMTICGIVFIGSPTSEYNCYYYNAHNSIMYYGHLDRPNYNGCMTVGDVGYATAHSSSGTYVYTYNSEDVSLNTFVDGRIDYTTSVTLSDSGIVAGSDIVFSDSSGYKVLRNSGEYAGTLTFYNNSGNVVYRSNIPNATSVNKMVSISKSGDDYFVLLSDSTICMIRNINSSMENYPMFGLDLGEGMEGYTAVMLSSTTSARMMLAAKDANGNHKVFTFDTFGVNSDYNTLYMINATSNGDATYGGSDVNYVSGGDYIDIYSDTVGEGSIHKRFYTSETSPRDTSDVYISYVNRLISIGRVSYNHRTVTLNVPDEYTYSYRCDYMDTLSQDKYLCLDSSQAITYE